MRKTLVLAVAVMALLPQAAFGQAPEGFVHINGATISNFDGERAVEVPGVHPNPLPGSSLLMVADLYGDFRDELVIVSTTEDGEKALTVVTSPEPID